jgi:hypothetical protein
MTEKETKTDTGAQSAPKPKTSSEADREALLFPEAARIKQAVRDSVPKSAGNKRRSKGAKRQTCLKLSTRAFELVEEARKRGLTMTSLIELSLAAYAASAGSASPANADRGKFNPEIEILIGSYQATNGCDRETAIEGLLIKLLAHRPTFDRPVTKPLQSRLADNLESAPPPDVGIRLSQACSMLNGMAPAEFRDLVRGGQIRMLAENSYSFVDVLKLAGFGLEPRPQG